MAKISNNTEARQSVTLPAGARHLPPPPAHTLGVTARSPRTDPFGKPAGTARDPCGGGVRGTDRRREMCRGGETRPRNGRPPTLPPHTHLCCSLPWDSVPSGGSSALPPPCQEPAGGVPSPLTPHITFLPARQASVQGPAVTSHPPLRGLLCGAAVGDGAESGGCHHAQPSKRRL